MYFLLKKQILTLCRIQKIIIRILFIIVIPLVSAKIELSNVYHTFDVVDGFNLLYIYLKFPLWWIIGMLNIYLLNKKVKRVL